MLSIEQILKIAEEAGASDVHFSVGIPPRMRVNGKLLAMDCPKLLPADTLDILVCIMTEAQRAHFEERGEYDVSLSIPNCGRYRVNAYKQRGFVTLAFRLVKSNMPSSKELGIPDSVIDLYRCRRGLILAAGPVGSGKSTTLAAVIDKINSNLAAHVITLERPIEYLHGHKLSVVDQREIGSDSDNYVNGLRAALREDADVILVSEMYDFETVNMVITAAETGHLVLSALHAVGAAETVNRIIDMSPPAMRQQICERLAKVLEAVVSQQLLPAVGEGDRVAAFEVMHVNQEIRKLIREGKQHQLADVIQNGKIPGVITMDEAIEQLYYKGYISRESAVEFALDADIMETKI